MVNLCTLLENILKCLSKSPTTDFVTTKNCFSSANVMVFLPPENRAASHVSKQMTYHESRLLASIGFDRLGLLWLTLIGFAFNQLRLSDQLSPSKRESQVQIQPSFTQGIQTFTPTILLGLHSCYGQAKSDSVEVTESPCTEIKMRNSK